MKVSFFCAIFVENTRPDQRKTCSEVVRSVPCLHLNNPRCVLRIIVGDIIPETVVKYNVARLF